ncbi:hypothetical protein HNQ81_003011 [Desulfoprunum benzoelyticum]|uniref:Uncharacterized protein n=1 Tax=Desulfoprunum benzoelyticum TaxID=1506996 RepID=A0A840V673_9BACT|nr:hypothetical protein [Desulfoprunum benzoelyticum]
MYDIPIFPHIFRRIQCRPNHYLDCWVVAELTFIGGRGMEGNVWILEVLKEISA